jgi:GT2 family glycosyltransferase
MKVSVIIPTRDRKEKLLRLLASAYANDFPQDAIEVITVDNGSSDGTADAVAAAFPHVRVIRSEKNLYCAGGRNAGAAVASGEFLFFVDDDNVLDSRCVSTLVTAMEDDKRVAVSAPLMLYYRKPDVIWCAGATINKLGMNRHMLNEKRLQTVVLPATIEADYFPNAYMVRGSLMKKGIVHDVKNFPHNWSEPDLCMRYKKMGYRLLTITAAITRHDIDYKDYGGFMTRTGVDKTYDQAKSRVLFRKRHCNSFVPWLVFFLLVLPSSTIVYCRAFLAQKDEPFSHQFSAYVRGTIDGFRARL